MTDCYACKVAEANPLTKLRGNADCVSCDARALAREFGGMTRDITDGVMRQAWPEVVRYDKGRPLFWMWYRAIDESRQATKEQR